MPKGNPGTDIAEILRRRIWYFNVSTKSGWKDYQLSRDFDLGKNNVSKRKTGKVRRRIFERLRKFDEMPFRGKHEEFVRLVESSVEGTAKLYLSPFWKLIGKKPLNLQQLRELVMECVRSAGLLSEVGNHHDLNDLMKQAVGMNAAQLIMFLRSSVEHHRLALEGALKNRPTDLDALALVGALFREAYFAGNLRVALMLEGQFANTLQQITEMDWMPKEISDKFFSLAVERVLTTTISGRDGLPEYLEMLNSTENKGSPTAVLLARHDRLLWGN